MRVVSKFLDIYSIFFGLFGFKVVSCVYCQYFQKEMYVKKKVLEI